MVLKNRLLIFKRRDKFQPSSFLYFAKDSVHRDDAMIVDDFQSPLAKMNSAKLDEFRQYQQKLPDPSLKCERYVEKIKSNGINNGNDVHMGPCGGFFYYNRVSGVKTPLKKGTKVEFPDECNEFKS